MNYQLEQLSAKCYLLHFLPAEKDGLLTSVLLINGEEHFFVVDTAYGSECMEVVWQLHRENFAEKSIVVLNTHSHWDHVWGNHAMKKHARYAHYLCSTKMETGYLEAQQANSSFIRGDVTCCPPDILFDSEIYFARDGVRFFHSPGHTDDSCSVWVESEKLLFAADNLENPLPYTETADLNIYIVTLKNYQKLEPQIVATSHSAVVSVDLIKKTVHYLENFADADQFLNKNSPEWQTHQVNKGNLGR